MDFSLYFGMKFKKINVKSEMKLFCIDKKKEGWKLFHEPCIEESTSEDHDSFTGGLFQLHLDAGELFVNDLYHPFDFLGRDGPRATLFPQEVHDMGGEFVAGLWIKEATKKMNKRSKKNDIWRMERG